MAYPIHPSLLSRFRTVLHNRSQCALGSESPAMPQGSSSVSHAQQGSFIFADVETVLVLFAIAADFTCVPILLQALTQEGAPCFAGNVYTWHVAAGCPMFRHEAFPINLAQLH